jgi:hypothetical protein
VGVGRSGAGGARGSRGGHGDSSSTTRGVASSSGNPRAGDQMVAMVAATHEVDELDAGVRASFSHELEAVLPNQQAREALLARLGLHDSCAASFPVGGLGAGGSLQAGSELLQAGSELLQAGSEFEATRVAGVAPPQPGSEGCGGGTRVADEGAACVRADGGEAAGGGTAAAPASGGALDEAGRIAGGEEAQGRAAVVDGGGRHDAGAAEAAQAAAADTIKWLASRTAGSSPSCLAALLARAAALALARHVSVGGPVAVSRADLSAALDAAKTQVMRPPADGVHDRCFPRSDGAWRCGASQRWWVLLLSSSSAAAARVRVVPCARALVAAVRVVVGRVGAGLVEGVARRRQ